MIARFIKLIVTDMKSKETAHEINPINRALRCRSLIIGVSIIAGQNLSHLYKG